MKQINIVIINLILESVQISLISIKKESYMDTLTLDVPTFIRCLEFAKEDAKTDEELHIFTEELLRLQNYSKILDMRQYLKAIKCTKKDS